MDDLKAIDIWALGMTFFRIINPDVEFPYEMELNSSPEKASKFEKLLKEMTNEPTNPNLNRPKNINSDD